ncbi:hypothetical protein IJ425_03365 [bacterium]|nr:hypothetical protein [bacterium]
MIKYVKLKEETEMPCMVCGSDSRIFIVKNMKHTKKHSFYICEKCFKSFKKDMQEARVKEYTETDLHRILRQKDPD